MKMNASSGQPCASICCKQDTVHPPGARCYWNVSFSTNETILPKILDLSFIKKVGPNDLFPRHTVPCPGNTVCYSDCNSRNNISTYFFGNDTFFMNDSMNGGLTCRLDAKDYCFKSYVTDETRNVTSVCKTFFDLLANMELAYKDLAIKRPVFLYTIPLSLIFLVITFFVYTIVPELKNLHGLILRTYMSCCFVFFLVAMIDLTRVNKDCTSFIMLPQHFACLTTFFWLNVMSFDIWWTFRSLRDCSRQSSRKKYIIYSIYAWGIPMLIIGVGLIIEFIPDVPKGIIKPGLRTGCWIQGGDDRTTVYLRIPMTITVAVNICFFVLAAINIAMQKKAAEQFLEGTDSRRSNDEKKRFYLYLKLFIVMGMTWLVEVQGLLFPFPFPTFIWIILITPNNAQGLIIFILFVWNDRTKRLLSKRLGLKDWAAIQWIERAVTRIRTLIRRPQLS